MGLGYIPCNIFKAAIITPCKSVHKCIHHHLSLELYARTAVGKVAYTAMCASSHCVFLTHTPRPRTGSSTRRWPATCSPGTAHTTVGARDGCSAARGHRAIGSRCRGENPLATSRAPPRPSINSRSSSRTLPSHRLRLDGNALPRPDCEGARAERGSDASEVSIGCFYCKKNHLLMRFWILVKGILHKNIMKNT